MIEFNELSESIQLQFTMNGAVDVDTSRPIYRHAQQSNTIRKYHSSQINSFIEDAKNKKNKYYGSTDQCLYRALEKYPIANKKVAIIGSVTPWYECICLAYGGKPTVIEYAKVTSDYGNIRYITVDEIKNTDEKFDYIISISSYEHDGLGRYGDPIDPDGDINAMDFASTILSNEGLMFMAVPVSSMSDMYNGKDKILWNAHRIYGKHRLPLLLKKYNVLDIFIEEKGNTYHQPVFVLLKK